MKELSEASSVYVAGEPLPEDSLLVAEFDLPPEFAWFNLAFGPHSICDEGPPI